MWQCFPSAWNRAGTQNICWHKKMITMYFSPSTAELRSSLKRWLFFFCVCFCFFWWLFFYSFPREEKSYRWFLLLSGYPISTEWHRMIFTVLSNLPSVPRYLILGKLLTMHCQINRGAVENKNENYGHGFQILVLPLTSCGILSKSSKLSVLLFSHL